MIEACELTKRYRATVASDDLTFDVRPGPVTGVPLAQRLGQAVAELRLTPAARIVPWTRASR